MRDVRETSIYTLLLPSLLATTAEERKTNRVELLVGYDSVDVFWNDISHQQAFPSSSAVIPTNFVRISLPPGERRIPFNELAQAAYEYGADFIVRINDDTKLISTGWITQGIERLRSFRPAYVGVVGPICEGGTKRPILTHDMVHRTHLDIFDTYYPKELDNWYIDDWITKVYSPSNAMQIKTWTVKHLVNSHGTRYIPNVNVKNLLPKLIDEGVQQIESYLRIGRRLRQNNKKMLLTDTLEATYGPLTNFVFQALKLNTMLNRSTMYSSESEGVPRS